MRNLASKLMKILCAEKRKKEERWIDYEIKADLTCLRTSARNNNNNTQYNGRKGKWLTGGDDGVGSFQAAGAREMDDIKNNRPPFVRLLYSFMLMLLLVASCLLCSWATGKDLERLGAHRVKEGGGGALLNFKNNTHIRVCVCVGRCCVHRNSRLLRQEKKKKKRKKKTSPAAAM